MTEYILEVEKARTVGARDKQKRKHPIRGAVAGTVGKFVGASAGMKLKKLAEEKFQNKLGGGLGTIAAGVAGAKVGGAIGKKLGETDYATLAKKAAGKIKKMSAPARAKFNKLPKNKKKAVILKLLGLGAGIAAGAYAIKNPDKVKAAAGKIGEAAGKAGSAVKTGASKVGSAVKDLFSKKKPTKKETLTKALIMYEIMKSDESIEKSRKLGSKDKKKRKERLKKLALMGGAAGLTALGTAYAMKKNPALAKKAKETLGKVGGSIKSGASKVVGAVKKHPVKTAAGVGAAIGVAALAKHPKVKAKYAELKKKFGTEKAKKMIKKVALGTAGAGAAYGAHKLAYAKSPKYKGAVDNTTSKIKGAAEKVASKFKKKEEVKK